MSKKQEQNLHEALIEQYPLFFMEMNASQERFVRAKNKKRSTPKRRLVESGNKSGKTEIGIAEDLAHAFGFRIWLKEDDPDYMIEIPIPNIGLIGCETLAHSIPEKIEPTIKRLIPDTCRYTMKKNPQGYVTSITLHTDPYGSLCGSKIFVRSYDQEPSTFEGLDYHWIHWDEPPPKGILQAAERGKIAHNAPSWFTMTPLKEAYIYDDYSLKAANMGGDDDEIFVIRGEIWDNCLDYCHKCDIEIKENKKSGKDGKLIRVVKNCPSCGAILGFMAKSGIFDYLKTLDPEEREAREKGLWKHLSGLVYKILDRDTHTFEDFGIPRHWTKIEAIDPHDAKPTCYLFGAISPEEIEIFGKMRNRIYFYDYLALRDTDLDSMVRKIKSKRETHGYSKPAYIIMDEKYGRRTQMEGKCWEDELAHRGIGYIKLSHSGPGDVELGHKLVREYLKPYYNKSTGTTKPGIMFARKNCSGSNGPIHSLFNYQYKPEKDKPMEEFKDFADLVRYVVLEEPKYRVESGNVIDFHQKQKEQIFKSRRLAVRE